MKIDEKLKKFFVSIISSPDCEGTNFVQKKIVPMVETLFFETVNNSSFKLPIGDILPLNDEDEKVRFAMLHNQDGTLSLGINENALSADYAGFKIGPYYKGSISQRNSRINDIIRCVFHEVRHAEQEAICRESDVCKLSPKAIIYTKESMLVSCEPRFYRANHDSFLIEREAIRTSYKKIAEFMAECVPNSEFSKKTERELVVSEKQEKKYNDCYFNKHIGLISTNPILEGEVEPFAFRVSELVDAQMCTNGWNLVKRFPVLKLVYNEDGTKKTHAQLLKEKREWINKNINRLQEPINVDGTITTIGSNISKIYDTIIETDKDYVNQMEQEFTY